MHMAASHMRCAPLSVPCHLVHGMQKHPLAISRRCLAALHKATPSDGDQPEVSADEMIQRLLTNDPQALEQVGRVSDAARRVAELQMEQARLARALAEAEDSDEASAQLRERRAVESANKLVAEAEAKAAGLLLKAAELEAQSAAAVRENVAAQAEVEGERVETAKAGTAAAAGGVVGSLPLAITISPTPLGVLFDVGSAAASAFLFGLVYRYALRQNVENLQLKGGVVAAFGLVRGIGQATVVLGTATDGLRELPSVDTVGVAAAAMGQSMLLFAFASVALEFAFQKGWVKYFAR